MKIELSPIYNRNGLVPVRKVDSDQVRIAGAKNDTGKSAEIRKSESFRALLSEAEASQLMQLFGKFDPAALTDSTENSPSETRPGQIIDIVV